MIVRPFDRERLAAAFQPLVRGLAFRMAGSPDEFEELVGDGNVGLTRALNSWQPDKSQFVTHAYTRIQGAMLDARRSRRLLTRQDMSLIMQADGARHKLAQRLRRFPTSQELAEHLGWTADKLATVRARAANTTPRSLEEPFRHDGTESDGPATLHDIVADPTAVPSMFTADRDRIAFLVSRLPARDRTVVWLYFWEDMTQLEIGGLLGVSAARVSQIFTAAVARLRARCGAELMELAA